jgi:AraC-like DNA-binding protein
VKGEIKMSDLLGDLRYNTDVLMSHAFDDMPNEEDYVLHIHDYYEILCLVSGSVNYLVEGHTYPMESGCIIIVRPSETHKLIVTGKDKYERYVLSFSSEFIRCAGLSDDLLSAFNNRPLGVLNQYNPDDFDGITPLELFTQMEEQCKSLGEKAAVASNLLALLCLIEHTYRTKKQSSENEESRGIGSKLLNYVNRHISDDISLKRVSEHIHLSPSQTNRTFKALTGTSLHDYVISKRLVMATELMNRGNGAMEVGRKCGFKDHSSFYRAYKKKYGKPPSQ